MWCTQEHWINTAPSSATSTSLLIDSCLNRQGSMPRQTSFRCRQRLGWVRSSPSFTSGKLFSDVLTRHQTRSPTSCFAAAHWTAPSIEYRELNNQVEAYLDKNRSATIWTTWWRDYRSWHQQKNTWTVVYLFWGWDSVVCRLLLLALSGPGYLVEYILQGTVELMNWPCGLRRSIISRS